MKICILEDDMVQATRLEHLLRELQPDSSEVLTFSSARTCLRHMETALPDLLFRNKEIELYEEHPVHEKSLCPVVLMDKKVLPASRLAGLEGFDCLPQPVERERLQHILEKYSSLKTHFTGNVDRFLSYMQQRQRSRKRFLVKTASGYQAMLPDEIVYLRADKKTITLANRENQLFQVEDYSLSAVADLLDESQFYRANRKFIINVNYIRRFKPLPDSRMNVELTIPIDPEILISRENAVSFKRWLGEC